MVRTFIVLCFVLLLAVPVLAQSADDYPKIQTSMGYANLTLPSSSVISGHHSGFSNSTGFNLTKTLGLENYMGIYGVGQGITLIADFFGGKATYRGAKVSPYAVAGIGIGYFTSSSSYGGTSSFATRFGGGVDIPINDSMAWKVEISRMNFHVATQPTPTGAGPSWTNGTNFQTGIVFTISQ